MSSLTAPRPQVNPTRPRKPLEPVAVVGRLLTGHGTRLPELFEGNAILEVESEGKLESYWTGLLIDPADGHISGVKLQKFATGEKYNLPAALDDCDFADATFRPSGCKHQQTLRQALVAVAAGLKTAPPSRPGRRVERDDATGPHTNPAA